MFTMFKKGFERTVTNNQISHQSDVS